MATTTRAAKAARGKAKKPKAKKPRGRPSLWSPKLAGEICERLSKGEPLAVICRDEHMPAVRTVSLWKETHPTFSADFARAREEGHDAIAAGTLEIADDARNDWMDARAEEGDEKALQFNGEHVQRSKLRIDTRLKLLAVWDKRYSPKSEVAHTGHLTLEQLVAGTDASK